MSKDQILDVLAKQLEEEAFNEKVSIVSKINVNMFDIKVKDCKKRRRPDYSNGQVSAET